MYQIDNSTAAPSIPASTAQGAVGFFTDGNPATGTAPTIVPAEFLNMLMMELLGVLSAAGITPSKSSFTQLASAIRAVNRQAIILADTGTAGAYAAANTPALTALPATGYAQWVNIAHANPGAATYSPDGLAAKPIYGLGLQALQGGELPVGVVCFRYLVQAGVNGGNGAWIIIESLGGPSQIAPGTASSHAATVGQLQSGYASFAIDTGTANTYVCNFTPAITTRAEGQPLRFKVKTANNGACTINDGLGVVALVGGAHTALQGGELIANGDAWIQWNSSIGSGSYILLFCTGAAEQVAPATQSQHAMQLGQAIGRLIGVQVFSTPGTFTYTQTPGTTRVIPEVQAAGGAGGGAPATGASVASLGAPGGAGAYAKSLITSAFSGVTITVGAGGTGVSGAAGNNGGPSSFGALVSCPGGRGGATSGPSSASFFAISSSSSAPSGGSIQSNIGQGSDLCLCFNATSVAFGRGGQSLFGAGAPSGGSGSPGSAATSPGSGGGGTALTPSLAALTGGAGAPGIVIVWEYA